PKATGPRGKGYSQLSLVPRKLASASAAPTSTAPKSESTPSTT
ncbi:unnamed protein product, partial [Adineta steineri]